MKHYFFSSKFWIFSKHYELYKSCRTHPVQSKVSFLLFLYTISWRYKRHYLYVSIDILLKLCTILLRNIRLFYTVFLLTIQKMPDSNLPPLPSPLFLATSLFLAKTLHTLYKSSPLKCKFSDFSLNV